MPIFCPNNVKVNILALVLLGFLVLFPPFSPAQFNLDPKDLQKLQDKKRAEMNSLSYEEIQSLSPEKKRSYYGFFTENSRLSNPTKKELMMFKGIATNLDIDSFEEKSGVELWKSGISLKKGPNTLAGEIIDVGMTTHQIKIAKTKYGDALHVGTNALNNRKYLAGTQGTFTTKDINPNEYSSLISTGPNAYVEAAAPNIKITLGSCFKVDGNCVHMGPKGMELKIEEMKVTTQTIGGKQYAILVILTGSGAEFEQRFDRESGKSIIFQVAGGTYAKSTGGVIPLNQGAWSIEYFLDGARKLLGITSQGEGIVIQQDGKPVGEQRKERKWIGEAFENK